ncbi:MAG: peptidase [Gemmatimonadetes bacterium]|nr:peptidase [Gemmatimonadota bacterium]
MTSTHRTAGLAFAAALCLAAVPARAQIPIRLGQTVSGELTASDPRVSDTDKSHYKAYVYHATRGEPIRVTMKSSAFDAFLSMGRMEGGTYRTQRFNDDGAGGTDARIDFVAPTDGDYVIRANSVSDTTGAYTLMLERGVAPGPLVNRTISVGQTVSGSLSERSPQEDDGTFYDQYTFHGRAGQTVQITMSSKDVDSYLHLGTMNGGTWSSIKTDDDGAGSGNDARITYTLPSDGDYVVKANTLSRASGAYTLAVEQGTPPRPVSSQDIRADQTVNGTLDSSDAKLDDGSYIDQYVYHGRAGEHLTITMKSTDFDSYLNFGTLNGGTFSSTQSDDDSGGGNDSQISVTLPANGDYAIRANSLMAGAAGSYTLSVVSGAASGK